MAKIPLDLVPGDFKRARILDPKGCLLERALERQYGGKWLVRGRITQRGVLVNPRSWRPGREARRVMDEFDKGCQAGEVFRGRRILRVYLHGKPLAAGQEEEAAAPVRSRSRSGSSRRDVLRSRPARRAAMTAGAASGLLVADGLAWVVLAVAAAVTVVAGAVVVRGRSGTGSRLSGRVPPAVPGQAHAPWRPGQLLRSAIAADRNQPVNSGQPSLAWPAGVRELDYPAPPGWPAGVREPDPGVLTEPRPGWLTGASGPGSGEAA